MYSYFCCQRKITNRPLAGTARRGKTPKEDLMLEKELLNDEKQRAEHIMLVDLGRNDVGKVCTYFSAGCETPSTKRNLIWFTYIKFLFVLLFSGQWFNMVIVYEPIMWVCLKIDL